MELKTRQHEDGTLALAVYVDGEYFGTIAQSPDENGKYHAARACERFDRAPRFDTYTSAAAHVTNYALDNTQPNR